VSAPLCCCVLRAPLNGIPSCGTECRVAVVASWSHLGQQQPVTVNNSFARKLTSHGGYHIPLG